MPAPANLVHEQSTTTGTGNFTTTAVNGKQRFSTAFGTGVTLNVFDYFISNQNAAEYERGTGHMSAVGTLVRDTVIESTNANALVSFTSGTKDVTNDVPAGLQQPLAVTQTANTLFAGPASGGAALPTFRAAVRADVSTISILTVNVQKFTSSGTYTPTAGMKYCIIEAWGAGGAGGGGASVTLQTAGAGGGAGGYSRLTASAATIGASQAVTIGAAGAPGAAGNNPGGAGGDTSVGTLCIAKGGSGGPGNAGAVYTTFGAGGVPGTGDITGPGQSGSIGYTSSSGPSFEPEMRGGSTLVGAGGVNDHATNPKTGPAGTGNGSGGAGGWTVAGGAVTGGAGTAGLVVITEFI